MMKVQDSKSHLLLLVLLASVAIVSAGWNSCAKKPCRNGGICEEQGYGYLCRCASGWTGSSCEQPTHPCVPNPCLHGGCCAINSNKDYRCDCDKGWTGRQCDTADDPCKGSPNPCGSHGECYIVSKNSYGYLCKCYLGWYGKNCDKACSAHCAAGCVSTGPGRCDGPCEDGYELTLDLECVDDPCNPNPCRYGGTCKADGSSYTCACKYSYSGPNCETHGNPCDSSPCLHDGTCRSDGKTYTCSCSAGYTGTCCETQTCSRKLDLVFLLDGSSIKCGAKSCPDWIYLLQFVKNVVSSFNIEPDATRVALVTVSSEGKLEWGFNKCPNANLLLSAIDKVTYKGGEIDSVSSVANLFTSFITAATLPRSDATMLGILISDGAPRLDIVSTIAASTALQALGMNGFVVCVTDKCPADFAKRMSSPPRQIDVTYFLVKDFSSINNVTEKVVKQICSFKKTSLLTSLFGF